MNLEADCVTYATLMDLCAEARQGQRAVTLMQVCCCICDTRRMLHTQLMQGRSTECKHRSVRTPRIRACLVSTIVMLWLCAAMSQVDIIMWMTSVASQHTRYHTKACNCLMLGMLVAHGHTDVHIKLPGAKHTPAANCTLRQFGL